MQSPLRPFAASAIAFGNRYAQKPVLEDSDRFLDYVYRDYAGRLAGVLLLCGSKGAV